MHSLTAFTLVLCDSGLQRGRGVCGCVSGNQPLTFRKHVSQRRKNGGQAFLQSHGVWARGREGLCV